MPRRDNAFRSGRLPDVNRGSMLGRRGKSRAGARATMDLGRLARGAELGVGDGERGPGGAAQVRTPSLIGSFFRSLFTRADNHDTRPVPRDGVAPAARRYGHLSGDAPPPGSRAGRAAAASSLGSLQSYATSTIRGAGAGCLSPASTSEVDVRKRVLVRRDESERLVFAEASKTGGGGALMSARAPAFDYPNFALGEYGGRNTWMSDVFVLMHNAIRWEIMDVYNILSSMQRRWTSLQMVDVWDFSEHWEVFEVFVAQYFEIEDQIIFPFMLNVAAQSSELARYHKVVKYNKERLESILLEIGLTLEKFNTAAPSEVMPILYDKLVSCLPKLLDYMTEQEQVLPKVFQQYCDPEDRTLLNRACANFLVRATNGRHGIAILTRWIEDSMVLQMWKNENLSARAKQSHKKWVAALQVEHVDIVNRFQRRMRNLQKDRRPGAMADRSDAPGRSGGGGGGRSALRDAAVADTLDP